MYKSIIKTDFVNFWFKFFLKSSDDSENSGDRIISKMRKKRRVKSSTPSKGEVSDDWDSSLKYFTHHSTEFKLRKHVSKLVNISYFLIKSVSSISFLIVFQFPLGIRDSVFLFFISNMDVLDSLFSSICCAWKVSHVTRKMSFHRKHVKF